MTPHAINGNDRLSRGLHRFTLMLVVASYLTRLASPFDPQPLNPMIWVTVAHVVCGALVFATTIVLALRSFRLMPATISAFKWAHT